MTKLRVEVLLVLAITFGTAGIRALLRLIDALLAPGALNQHSVTLNNSQSAVSWLDLALQLSSAGVLFAWGGLALYLLGERGLQLLHWRRSDLPWGATLAAIIGLPGLFFYATAVQLGLSKVVIPSGLSDSAWEIPVLLLWSAANAFGEEVVVVAWLLDRLQRLGVPVAWAIGASALLRGSYHLYQGVSAGLGNIVMGIIYAGFFARTGRVWPLVLGHFLIDAFAFVGYSLLNGDLSWLGL